MTCVPTCRYDGMLDASAGGCLRHMRCTKGDIYTSFSSTHQCWLRRRYQNDLKRIHRASVTCKVQTKQVQYPESITENTPQQKKTSTAKKAPLQKYHTWNSDSKSFWLSFFGGFPFPALFTWNIHVEHSPVNGHCSTANLRRFRFHPWSNSSQDEGWLIILYTFLSIKLCLFAAKNETANE